jgi:hypothetical protein
MVNRIDIGLKERRAFLGMMALYFVFLGVLRNESGIIQSYGTDILFIPMLMVSIKIVRWLFDLSFPLGKKEVLFSVLYAAAVFEWILPALSENYVGDPFDVLAYFLGGTFYVVFISSKNKYSNQTNNATK